MAWTKGNAQGTPSSSSSVSSLTATNSLANSAGDLLVLAIHTKGIVSAVSDSKNGAYTKVAAPTANGGGTGYLWVFKNAVAATSGTNTITITLSTSGACSGVWQAFSGGDGTTGVTGQYAGNSTSASVTLNAPNAGDLVLLAAGDTQGSTWTSVTNLDGVVSHTGGAGITAMTLGYKLSASTGSLAYKVNTNGTFDNLSASAGTFALAGSATPNALKSQARETSLTRITTLADATRAPFLSRAGYTLATRSRFLSRIALLETRLRAPFATRHPATGQSHAGFVQSARLKDASRARLLTAAHLSQATYATFPARVSLLAARLRSPFVTRHPLSGQSRDRFIQSAHLKDATRSPFPIRIGQLKSSARSPFSTRFSLLLAQTHATFKIAVSAGHLLATRARLTFPARIAPLHTPTRLAASTRAPRTTASRVSSLTRVSLLAGRSRALSQTRALLRDATRALSQTRAPHQTQTRASDATRTNYRSTSRTPFFSRAHYTSALRPTFKVFSSLRSLNTASRLHFVQAAHLIVPSRSKAATRVGIATRTRSRASTRFSLQYVAESIFLLRIHLTAFSRGRFVTRSLLLTQQRAKSVSRAGQRATAQVKSATRSPRATFLRSSASTRIRLGTTARERFASRTVFALATRAASRVAAWTRSSGRAGFRVDTRVITRPFIAKVSQAQAKLAAVFSARAGIAATFTQAAPRLTARFTTLTRVNPTFAPALARLSVVFTRSPQTMPTPNTTIQVTATCTDQAGVLVSTCSAVRVTLTFPDLTIQTLTLASGVTNLGAGQYQVVYNTKGVGTVVEDWQFTAIDGVTVAEVRNHTAVEY